MIPEPGDDFVADLNGRQVRVTCLKVTQSPTGYNGVYVFASCDEQIGEGCALKMLGVGNAQAPMIVRECSLGPESSEFILKLETRDLWSPQAGGA